MNWLFMLEGTAGATGTQDTGAMSILGGLLPMILIFGLMYVILILPQRKREKKTRQMIDSAIVGDSIVSIGGMVGKVVNIKDDEFTIESSVERTKITIKKWAIKEVIKPSVEE